MLLTEQELYIPAKEGHAGALEQVLSHLAASLGEDLAPTRLAVTDTVNDGYDCEIGVLSTDNRIAKEALWNGFQFQRRRYANDTLFNAVMLVPTGIGAEIGGHSGDAGAVARLLAACCDTLVTHPNVMNAADINELPDNALYVEGSVVSRLMMGTVGLQKVRSNRVALVVDGKADPCFRGFAINSASAARAAMGLDCPIVLEMNDTVTMKAAYSKSGRAAGEIQNLDWLCEILETHRSEYDAVALNTLIDVPDRYHGDYFKRDTNLDVNPWGGVEAMLTHALSLLLNVPCAHAPMMSSKEVMELDVGIVDPRKAAEAVSTTYLHCVLKGLHRSPRIVPIHPPAPSKASACDGKADRRQVGGLHDCPGLLTAADISCLVIPDRCIGLPTLAALEQGIAVIAVRENRNRMRNNLQAYPFAPGQLIIVDNYLEAAGVIGALRAGVALETVRRPLDDTRVLTNVLTDCRKDEQRTGGEK